MVRCDIGSAYCDDWTVNCKEKNRVPLNVTKIESDAMLVLLNVTMEPSNVRKK